MQVSWSDDAWLDYEWQTQDRKTLKRINALITDIKRSGHQGIGEPEQLRGDLSGWWSRRIDAKNRLVYRVNGEVEIAQCVRHYSDT